MADVNFYHLTRSTLKQTLPKLLEKIVASGKRGLVVASDQKRAEEINEELWSSTRKFLPHGSKEDGFATEQPIYITYEADNPNSANILIMMGDAEHTGINDFEKSLILFDGNNPAQVATSRQRWKKLQEAGHTLIYWQQDERGKWFEGN